MNQFIMKSPAIALLVLAALLALLAQAFNVYIEPEEIECIEELKIDKKVIASLSLMKPYPEDNEDVRRFLECGWKKLKIVNDQNDVDWQQLEALILKNVTELFENAENEDDQVILIGALNVIKQMLDECRGRDIRGNTVADTVLKINNCFGEVVRTYMSRKVHH